MGGGSRGEKGPSSSKRSRKSGKDLSSDSDAESPSMSSGTNSDESYREKNRKSSSLRGRSKSRRSRRGEHNSDEESDEEFRRKKRKSKRQITEEEISEYIVKKAQRKAMRAAKKLKGQAVSGYSNDSNPFGDSNLNELFVWRKKIEVDVNGGKSIDEYSTKAAKKRQHSRMAEIEKVKKRREETAYEKAQREEEMAMLARERARAEFQDWEKKEEEFHFDQSKVRSQIRLKEGRTKPIDVLFKILNSDDFDIDIEEPSSVFKGLTVRELEELRDDIKMNLDMDRASEQHITYWEALLVVCNWEISEACKKDAVDRARVRGEALPPELLAEERGLHSSIETDVRNLLVGKSSKELEKLRVQIESQMSSGTAKVVEYWEAVLKRLKIYRARACLKEVYTKKLRQYLHKFDKVPKNDQAEADHDEGDHDADAEIRESDHEAAEIQNHSPERIPQEQHYSEDDGNFSPELLHRDSDDDDEVIDPEVDKARLETMRRELQEEQQRRMQEAAKKLANPHEENFEIKAIKAMGALEEGDAVFGSGAEVSLDSQVYWWHDKYRPRKPKYFNRVHTGYEWNKYNQTHYDHDNPPPKIVQGYKFNIFYPDLVDKTKAPVYTIEKDGNSDETCIIRFHAGPPYEDIAFRIVNKEWEYSHKKGFKCTFERGILHVYFNFKRYRYRR